MLVVTSESGFLMLSIIAVHLYAVLLVEGAFTGVRSESRSTDNGRGGGNVLWCYV